MDELILCNAGKQALGNGYFDRSHLRDFLTADHLTEIVDGASIDASIDACCCSFSSAPFL